MSRVEVTATVAAPGRLVQLFRAEAGVASLTVDVLATVGANDRSSSRSYWLPLATLAPSAADHARQTQQLTGDDMQWVVAAPKDATTGRGELRFDLLARRDPASDAWTVALAWNAADAGANMAVRAWAAALPASGGVLALPPAPAVYDASRVVEGNMSGANGEVTLGGAAVARFVPNGLVTQAGRDVAVASGAMVEANASMMRCLFNSGVLSAHTSNPGPFSRARRANLGSMGIHDHAHNVLVCGLGELAVLVNGFYLQTRHNDYGLGFRANADVIAGVPPAKVGSRMRACNVLPPPVPAAVLALPTGFQPRSDAPVPNPAGTQLAWMRRVYADAPEQCVWMLSYVEAWVQRYEGAVADAYPTERHGNFSTEFKTLADAANYYSMTGFSRADENAPQVPAFVTTTRPDGTQELGVLQYRVSSFPVATLAGTPVTRRLPVTDGTVGANGLPVTVDVEFDLAPLPYTRAQAVARQLGPTNGVALRRTHTARFAGSSPAAPPTTWDAHERTGVAAFDLPGVPSAGIPSLVDLCRKVPGLDGYLHAPIAAWHDPTQPGVRYGTRDPETGLGYYDNVFGVPAKDASGFTGMRGKSFCDNNHLSAVTRNPGVVGNVSWMVPLELVLRTPRGAWNPLGVAVGSSAAGTGASAGDPRSAAVYPGAVYTVPASAFGNTAPLTFQASTGLNAWVRTPAAGAVLMQANGTRVVDYEGTRLRFPVAVDASAQSTVGAEVDALRLATHRALSALAAPAGPLSRADIDDLLLP